MKVSFDAVHVVFFRLPFSPALLLRLPSDSGTMEINSAPGRQLRVLRMVAARLLPSTGRGNSYRLSRGTVD